MRVLSLSFSAPLFVCLSVSVSVCLSLSLCLSLVRVYFSFGSEYYTSLVFVSCNFKDLRLVGKRNVFDSHADIDLFST